MERGIGIGRDAWGAVLLAALLSAAWTWMGWADLRYLTLPDSDDAMRLAQIRDLLAGQGFNDWTQYRLAPPVGAPMHWSRINDLIPAAMIALGTPLFGRFAAELGTVILYPAMLFAAALFLAARIARAIGPAQGAVVAILIALLAYPAMSLFRPGRIDHHALQIVLVQLAILAAVVPPGVRSGLAAGCALALGFGIGLEAAPQSAALIAALVLIWVAGRDNEHRRLLGLGAGLAAPTLAMLALMRPTLWSSQWCDGFTPASTTAAIAGGVTLMLLAVAHPHLRGWRWRLAAALVLGALLAAALLAAYPDCVSGPYGPMDPFLRHAIVDHVTEAQGPFDAPSLAAALPPVGMTFAAAIAGAWLWWRRRDDRARLAPVVAVVGASAVIALSQVRGAYIGSAAAAPLLAQLVIGARTLPGARRLPALVGAWLVSAGIAWVVLPSLLAPDRSAPPPGVGTTGDCRAGDLWRQFDGYPSGVTMAPIDHGARILAGTRHSTIAASYHRNNAGNRAMYAFFLSDPARARRIAARWRVRYVLLCPTDFAELDAARAYPRSLAVDLQAGRVPGWLQPLPLRGTAMALYRVR